jgi:hypothetical protein
MDGDPGAAVVHAPVWLSSDENTCEYDLGDITSAVSSAESDLDVGHDTDADNGEIDLPVTGDNSGPPEPGPSAPTTSGAPLSADTSADDAGNEGGTDLGDDDDNAVGGITGAGDRQVRCGVSTVSAPDLCIPFYVL